MSEFIEWATARAVLRKYRAEQEKIQEEAKTLKLKRQLLTGSLFIMIVLVSLMVSGVIKLELIKELVDIFSKVKK